MKRHPLPTERFLNTGVYRGWVDKESEVGFTYQSDGRIVCDDCDEIWCKHIKKSVVRNEDQAAIWNLYDEMDPDTHLDLEIPMAPAEANLWCLVALVKTKFEFPTYKVVISSEFAMAGWAPPSNEPKFIGFIHPSEGRNVIRSMLFDWFEGEYGGKKQTCTNKGHGYKAQIKWDMDMRHSGQAKLQRWAVFATGKCITCNSIRIDSNDWPDDLVPDAQPGRKVF